MRSGAIALLSLLSCVVVAQDTKQDDTMKNCPMHDQHQPQSHHSIVQSHGDQAMGFPHDKTTHHFRMLSDGGAIEVTANDPNDKTNANAIRSHLSHIAVMLGNGDFSAPMFIHDCVPPGITTMQLMKSEISYKYEEIASGGRWTSAQRPRLRSRPFTTFSVSRSTSTGPATTPTSRPRVEPRVPALVTGVVLLR